MDTQNRKDHGRRETRPEQKHGDRLNGLPEQKPESRLRKVSIAIGQGTLVAAIYFGLFSILLYPAVHEAGLI